jgi:PEP-CTERM motif-containing protein
VNKLISSTVMSLAMLVAANSNAGMITFSDDTPNDVGANQSRAVTFSLDASTVQVSSAQLELTVGETDEGFAIVINGSTIFDVAAFDKNDPGHPIGVDTGLNQPWFSGSSPRILVSISEAAVAISALINSNDSSYTSIGLLTAATLPAFVDGVNTLTIINRNQFGPGGTRKMAIAGTVVSVPEPSSLILLLLGVFSVLTARKIGAK